jgi:peptidoglycan/LPS O-acetylase OafA/YrhL
MVYHFTQHNGLHWLGGAWVAVDLFFVLSGFVIAFSYGDKILQGMTFREFVWLRFIRLAPMYFLGLGLGLLAILLSMLKAEALQIDPRQVITAFTLGLVWLPYFHDGIWPFGTGRIPGATFPLNDPGWSLFFELLVNLVFFFWVYFSRKSSSLVLVLLAGGAFIFCTFWLKQINPGWGAENFYFGLPRVIAEFFFGTLIFTLGLHLKVYPKTLLLIVSTLVLISISISNTKVALVNTFLLLPLTVILMSTVTVTGRLRAICKALGDLSYPLYVLHFPLYRLAFALGDIKSLTPVTQTLLIGGLCASISFLLIGIDLKIRKWLTARLLPTKLVEPPRPG